MEKTQRIWLYGCLWQKDTKKKSKILKKVVEKTSGLWLYRCLKDERTLKICNYFFFIHEKVVYLGYEVLIEKNYPQCKLFFLSLEKKLYI